MRGIRTHNVSGDTHWFHRYLWRKPDHPEKTTDLSQVIDKHYQIMLYRVQLPWAGFELTTLVVIGTDCIGSCKSNYHTITTTTVSTIIRFSFTYHVVFARYVNEGKYYDFRWCLLYHHMTICGLKMFTRWWNMCVSYHVSLMKSISHVHRILNQIWHSVLILCFPAMTI